MPSLRAAKRAVVVAATGGKPRRNIKDAVFPYWFYPCFAISCLACLAMVGGLAWLLWQLFKMVLAWLIGRGGW